MHLSPPLCMGSTDAVFQAMGIVPVETGWKYELYILQLVTLRKKASNLSAPVDFLVSIARRASVTSSRLKEGMVKLGGVLSNSSVYGTRLQSELFSLWSERCSAVAAWSLKAVQISLRSVRILCPLTIWVGKELFLEIKYFLKFTWVMTGIGEGV